MNVKLIAITQYLAGDGSPETLIEHAGRVCYRSAGHGDPAAFVKARLRDGHESIVEHASATFEVSGISRACSHQLVRHRLASYSQESQRYVDAAGAEFVVPPGVAERGEDHVRLYLDFNRNALKMYRLMRADGIAKEDARFVLPNAAATRLVLTMNFREYLHFFRQRITPEAQWEIRALAVAMLRLLAPHSPAVFGALAEEIESRYLWFQEEV